MRLENIKDIDRLFAVVDSCEGQVHLVTKEGDDIVLTSKLSRFVVSALKDEGNEKEYELELVCEYPKDTIKIMEYLANC